MADVILIRHRESGREVCRAEVARTFRARSRGLLGRSSLPPGEGLLIVPCRAVHTFFMRFAIDVIFLDRAGRIVGLRHRLVPWRATRTYPEAHSTLELRAGEAGSLGLAMGDHLSWDGAR